MTSEPLLTLYQSNKRRKKQSYNKSPSVIEKIDVDGEYSQQLQYSYSFVKRILSGHFTKF